MRDGSQSIKVSKDFDTTPWKKRCFNELLKLKGCRSFPALKKFSIYTQLQRMVKQDENVYYIDVARLVHCYLLASLFMPTSNTSIPWCLCSLIEDFNNICTYDWSELIVSQLNKKLAQTRTMKAAGCAMLLPV